MIFQETVGIASVTFYWVWIRMTGVAYIVEDSCLKLVGAVGLVPSCVYAILLFCELSWYVSFLSMYMSTLSNMYCCVYHRRLSYTIIIYSNLFKFYTWILDKISHSKRFILSNVNINAVYSLSIMNFDIVIFT